MEDKPPSTRVDLWVFRDGKKLTPTRPIVAALVDALRKLQSRPPDSSAILDALIRAGEIESAFSDAALPIATRVATITDALARQLVQESGQVPNYAKLVCGLTEIDLPEATFISPPEGFSYYGLNPRDFVEVARRLCRVAEPIAVVGIRSIGVTLSAVVAAVLTPPESPMERISLRPTGHPYDRVANFSADQARWISEKSLRGSQFLVVDEGPGRSGSTFLSVAEALVALGIPKNRVTLIGSRIPNCGELCTKNAQERWDQFRFVAVDARSARRFQGHTYLGGGEWRRLFIPDEKAWPASWPEMERSKFLSPDGNSLFKFEGMGRIGEEVRSRAKVLAQTGFGCSVHGAKDGYSRYQIVQGRPLRASDVSSALLDHIANYCMMRCSEFKATVSRSEPLAEMARFNIQQEFGIDCNLNENDLPIEEFIIADGRMQPHEWLLTKSGSILKSDAVSHGDDHFFPGPTDIAWDLAGTIVEWNLESHARDFLLDRFQQLSGRNLHRQVDAYCLAYSIFRMGICQMAIPTANADEQRRLYKDYDWYRSATGSLLHNFTTTDDRFFRNRINKEERVA